MRSGIESVDVIELMATGYAVQQTTKTKISQTWLASQTGPIAWWACSRVALRPAPPTAREERPEAGAEVGAREHRVGREPDEDEDDRDVSEHRGGVGRG